jgi:methoxymalonate biosynthesis protein
MKKLLIWDADDTLWNGMIISGDVSITPERVALVRELRDRGVLQSIASYNTTPDLLSVLAKHQIDDCFLSVQGHFGVSKSYMIKVIMEELGISRMEDVVYMDDQMFNIREVQTALPGVIALFPDGIDMTIEKLFTKGYYTDDDRSRVRRYRNEEDRKRAAILYNGNYLDFLRSCDMKAKVETPTEDQMDRVIDLIERANRLSIIGANFSNDEIRAMRHELLGCWSTDVFGDNGLVGVICCVRDTIPLFVVSCRMQGKGIGSFLMGTVLNQRLDHHIRVVWKRTEYNGPMGELLDYFGFEEAGSMGNDMCLHTLDIEKPATLPDWINPL